jgi:hypothetical protein
MLKRDCPPIHALDMLRLIGSFVSAKPSSESHTADA